MIFLCKDRMENIFLPHIALYHSHNQFHLTLTHIPDVFFTL